MAQAGRRVLLVDADLRKPTAHKKFGTAREPGLVQHLFSDDVLDADGLLEPADDLRLLPAGRIAPNPSELLGSRRMRETVEAARERFDVVIFDAPPVLAATDAVLLSTQCDATLVVCRAGKTKDYELRSALDELAGVGAHVIGTVLNGFDVSKSYGYKYKYAYRYGSDYAYGSPQGVGPPAPGDRRLGKPRPAGGAPPPACAVHLTHRPPTHTMTLRTLAALAALTLAALPATAQTVGRVEGRQATPGGYFVNARAGEPTTRVYVWGTVRNPRRLRGRARVRRPSRPLARRAPDPGRPRAGRPRGLRPRVPAGAGRGAGVPGPRSGSSSWPRTRTPRSARATCSRSGSSPRRA